MKTVMELADRISSIGSATFMNAMSEALADETIEQIDQCFRYERDPYGRAWEPLKYRPSVSILDLTHKLRNSFRKIEVRPGRFIIQSDSEYAVHHQYGTKTMAARKIVPDGNDLGLFGKALQDKATAVFEMKLRGLR